MSEKNGGMTVVRKIGRGTLFLFLFGAGMFPTFVTTLHAGVIFGKPCKECVNGVYDESVLILPIYTLVPFVCAFGAAKMTNRRLMDG